MFLKIISGYAYCRETRACSACDAKII